MLPKEGSVDDLAWLLILMSMMRAGEEGEQPFGGRERGDLKPHCICPPDWLEKALPKNSAASR